MTDDDFAASYERQRAAGSIAQCVQYHVAGVKREIAHRAVSYLMYDGRLTAERLIDIIGITDPYNVKEEQADLFYDVISSPHFAIGEDIEGVYTQHFAELRATDYQGEDIDEFLLISMLGAVEATDGFIPWDDAKTIAASFSFTYFCDLHGSGISFAAMLLMLEHGIDGELAMAFKRSAAA
jgi:hypothetical protein